MSPYTLHYSAVVSEITLSRTPVKGVTFAESASSCARATLPSPPSSAKMTVPAKDIRNVRMTSPFERAGRVRQWLGAVQAAMVVGRASVPPALDDSLAASKPQAAEAAHRTLPPVLHAGGGALGGVPT
mgnify:CR=1 FL=1